jgi:two-component system chemotaxis sensor kinase CheA
MFVLGRSLREMRAAISRVRMVPIADLFARMPFVVRDLARGSEKRARVVIDGNQIEVDKFVVERLKEPLLHLVRNAFAHGIEPVAEREAAGKPGEATLTLQARTVGEFVVIQVHDDGRGIDAERVALRARGLGIAAPEKPNSDVLLDILCTPGFSTREAADRAAGRGVGMAVVANTVRELGGRITLETSRALGTRFTLSLPLTLSIADAIIVTIGAQICAVPQSAVEEIVQIATDQIRTIRNTEVIPYRDGLLPLVRLAPFFRTEAKANGHATVLVATSERGVIGLLVDSVRTQREIVVRPLTDPLLRVRGISGATELGDGRPILILDANALSQGVVRPVSNADPAGRNDGNARALP